MSDDDQSNLDFDDQPDAGAPRVSRDTLLLLAALTFLIVAVALTFLFPLGSDNQNAEFETTTGTGSPVADGSAYPVGTGSPVANNDAYPGASPSDVAGGAATAYPAGGTPIAGNPNQRGTPTNGDLGTPTNGDNLATTPGGLNIATRVALGETTAAQVGTGVPDDDESYPGDGEGDEDDEDDPYPVPEGTAPRQVTTVPTFNPVVTTPNNQPVTQPTIGQTRSTAFPTITPAGQPPVSQPQPTITPAGQPPVSQPQPPSPPESPKEPPPTVLPLPTASFPLTQTTPIAFPTTSVISPISPLIPLPPVVTQPQVDVLRGEVRWAAAESPIILKRDVQVAPGATLIIEPGVEVRLDPGVSIFVDGAQMLALGLPEAPIRFVGNTGARWSGIFGRPGSFITLDNTVVNGGGVGGTVMAVDQSELVMRGSRFNDNGGSVLLDDTKLEMRNSEISGNDMPFGASLEIAYTRGNFVTMVGNRVGGNRLSDGAPEVRIASQSSFDTLVLDVQSNLFRGGTSNLVLSTNGLLQGNVACNTLIGGDLGLSIRTQTLQVPEFPLVVANNFIDQHTPPIIPIYLDFGIGRGAASEIALDMRNNWWGEATGPYEPNENADGRGDAVGENIDFIPWLTSAPACVPGQ